MQLCIYFLNAISLLALRCCARFIGITKESDPGPFLPTYSYTFVKVDELKKNDLIKARKVCNIFRFINDLNSINDSGEYESSYSNIYPEELQLGEENTDQHEASFLYLNIKIKDGKFHFDRFDKRDFEILGWCPAGPVLPHGEKVPL